MLCVHLLVECGMGESLARVLLDSLAPHLLMDTPNTMHPTPLEPIRQALLFDACVDASDSGFTLTHTHTNTPCLVTWSAAAPGHHQ
jgi:hypothetical protein